MNSAGASDQKSTQSVERGRVSAVDPDGLTRDDLMAPDDVLDFFLTVTVGFEDSDNQFGITLTVNGTVISGNVIPRGRWIKLWLDQIRRASPQMADGLAPAYEALWASWKERTRLRDEQDLPQLPVGFIHLQDAKIWQGDGVPISVEIWRGRISKVDGWCMGTLGRN